MEETLNTISAGSMSDFAHVLHFTQFIPCKFTVLGKHGLKKLVNNLNLHGNICILNFVFT